MKIRKMCIENSRILKFKVYLSMSPSLRSMMKLSEVRPTAIKQVMDKITPEKQEVCNIRVEIDQIRIRPHTPKNPTLKKHPDSKNRIKIIPSIFHTFYIYNVLNISNETEQLGVSIVQIILWCLFDRESVLYHIFAYTRIGTG